MTTFLQNIWQTILGQKAPLATAPQAPQTEAPRARPVAMVPLDIAQHDPLTVYFQSSPGAVEVEKLNFESPVLKQLKESQVKLVVPLVSQGELIGLLTLGQRLSEQDYSTDDRVLLSNLAAQAAPAVRVAQLVRQQQIEVQARERLEQELRVARLIQQTLLPKELPEIEGWDVSAYYQPARAVGGDFYDFIYLADGRLGIVVGDVTDKGVPAALLMATTRANLRAAALRFDSPGQVLAQVNEVLCPEMPPKMFVTCLYAILDTNTGRLMFANAGHDVAFCWSEKGVEELRARGMPLGLMSGMYYEEKERMIPPGESIIFYSDGLVEAHSPKYEMFGFPRLSELLGQHPGGASIIELLLSERDAFTGPDWEQEDDTTMVIVQRSSTPMTSVSDWPMVASFEIASEPGNEREVIKRMAEVAKSVDLPPERIEKLKTAVAEATMNAIEHGNQNRADLMVGITVSASPDRKALAVRIKDHALTGRHTDAAATPDLDAKLAGLQSPRGWGLFLIEKMVDKMNVIDVDGHHILELIMYEATAEGERHD